jgi:hypothetical protein
MDYSLLRAQLVVPAHLPSLPALEAMISSSGTCDWPTGVASRVASTPISGEGADGVGFSRFTGYFADAANLPIHTWCIESSGAQILFHYKYKVAFAVPEPGTLALARLRELEAPATKNPCNSLG